jgi:GNAT superfamily N-acetyltransferase
MEEFRVRAAGASDIGRYRGILERASDQDRFFRFFGHVARGAGLHLEELGAVFAAGTVAVIAEAPDGTPLGVAHAVPDPSRASAEMAILVAADAQGNGVGAALVRALCEALRARGCRRLVAQSMEGNVKFAALARASHFRIAQRERGVTTWEQQLGTGKWRRSLAPAQQRAAGA